MTQIKLSVQTNMPLLRDALVSDLDRYIRETIEDAARAWLSAALDIVPAWSGASRATFQALASAVNVNVPISRAANAPDRIALGRLLSRGGVSKADEAGWMFYYETSLQYLIANETKKVAPRTEGLFSSMKTPTPFKFREAGNKAAAAVINAQLKNLDAIFRDSLQGKAV